jgi:hypothetical protein
MFYQYIAPLGLEEFESEAREVFPNTDLALEGVAYTV